MHGVAFCGHLERKAAASPQTQAGSHTPLLAAHPGSLFSPVHSRSASPTAGQNLQKHQRKLVTAMHFFFIVLGNDKKLLRDLKEETAEEEAEGQEESKALRK